MNTIDLSKYIEESYAKYLETTFYFKDPDFRKSFKDELKSGVLSNGPFLESTPVFQTGKQASHIFSELLGSEIDPGLSESIFGSRPLYTHQEKAIIKTYQGNNILVATGTGSGKTESFLFPIILSLYKEFINGTLGSGVRALILYPMNALANDQRDRLGEICSKLKQSNSRFHFTFGQYIGDTPEDEKDNSFRNASQLLSERKPGELVLRREMRETPPNILLTNYSMLEYLLLRPNDSSLFDNGNSKDWKFIVLDEAHQYKGSKGTEMALLIRRLKHRLRLGGSEHKFQCIATSATLMGDDKDRKPVAKFASDLFGEPFDDDDIILGETKPIEEIAHSRLNIDDYRNLEEQKESDKIAQKVNEVFLESKPYSEFLGRVLTKDLRSLELRKLITGNPLPIEKIIERIFTEQVDDKVKIDALSSMVDLLSSANMTESSSPLIAIRYHFFLKTLEGVYISYYPDKRVILSKDKDDSKVKQFEIALCRECGQHYIVGRERNGKLVEAVKNLGNEDFATDYYKPIEVDENSDELDVKKLYYLCAQCGDIGIKKLSCGHSNIIRVMKEDTHTEDEKKDQLKKCSNCGYHAAGNDPVREIIYGHDGPNSVITTSLFNKLDKDKRKILAFADNRQEAAFFAWYLQKSYEDIRSRNILFNTIKKLSDVTNEGMSLSELAYEFIEEIKKRRVLPSSMGAIELERNVWARIYNELLTDENRISLEGTGLVQWLLTYPEWLKIPQVLTQAPLMLNEKEAGDLFFILLDTFRSSKAIELRSERIKWSDIGVQGSQMKMRLGERGNQSFTQSWDGKQTRRAKILTKLLVKRGVDDKEIKDTVQNILQKIWISIRRDEMEAERSNEKVLLNVDNDCTRLNPEWYRLRILRADETIFQCSTCGRIQHRSVLGLCMSHQCKGNLGSLELKDLAQNHYRSLYEEQLTESSLRVEEHTAQLDNQIARDFQNDFKKNKINVLSCSTTFELGVDLGDLDNVFLRNVPPESFNYAQRVGRSGRRKGRPGFAITYCRRRPHDLYHFNNPVQMLKGQIKPPIISLMNDKIALRHISATALSFFFKEYPQKFKSVKDLFNDLNPPYIVAPYKEYLLKNKKTLVEYFKNILPESNFDNFGFEDGKWVDSLTGLDSRLQKAETELISDYNTLQKLKQDSSNAEDYKKADWAKWRINTILSEAPLTFLSRKTVIPKYGFPVDVVELDTQRISDQNSSSVSLQRDLSLAIAEFAPGSELIANKKLWKSYGLKKVAEREWKRGAYAYCKVHNNFLKLSDKSEPEIQKELEQVRCCNSMIIRKFVDPEFGFVTNRDKPKNPEGKVKRLLMTRPFFADFISPNNNPTRIGYADIWNVVPGRLINVCEGFRGRGFWICEKCGAGFSKLVNNHKDALDKECKGILGNYSLAHEFETDVLKIQFYDQGFEVKDEISFTNSLGFALLEGVAETLQVPSTDLNITILHQEGNAIPPIIVYDNVPGGAGLVARMEDKSIFEDALMAALNRVSGQCGCGEDTSCYGCLRSYRNQYLHDKLIRGQVLKYLSKLNL